MDFACNFKDKMMADSGVESGVSDNSALILAIIVGGTVLLIFYISNLLRSQKKEDEEKTHQQVQKKGGARDKTSGDGSGSSTHKGSKKKQVAERAPRDNKQATFTHPWLVTSLKGHMSATEALDPGGGGGGGGALEEEEEEEDSCSSSSSSQSGSEGCSSSSTKSASQEEDSGCGCDAPVSTGGDSSEKSEPSLSPISRRQKRKNRLRRDDYSPASSPNQPSRKNKPYNTKLVQKVQSKKHTPLYQYTKLNISDSNLSALLRHYLLSPEELLVLGYPVESSIYPSKAIIYKSPMSSFFFNQPYPPGSNHTFLAASSHFDVNAPEFIPSSVGANPTLQYDELKVEWKPHHWPKTNCSDAASSGGDSDGQAENTASNAFNSSSANASEDSDTKVTDDSDGTNYEVPQTLLNHNVRSDEKKCVRCGRGFFMLSDGEYLTQERCSYHWGKLQRVCRIADNKEGEDSDPVSVNMEYDCCHGRKSARGCTTGKLHVWYGVGAGVNGPFEGYVRTRPRKTPPPNGYFGVYAVDCEMCFTTQGLELAKISVVAADGRLVYNALVKPEASVVDYNTRFSGITARELAKATKTLRDVQNDLMGFINADTILIGHGLENDLRALKLIHGTVVDTAVVFPHYYGLPYRRSLKSLVNAYLHRDIQKKATGHDSLEDARACLELMLWRIRKDFHRTVFIWNTKDFTQKDHKSLRINVEYDHAKFIKWSPDSKAFIIHKGVENVVEVYKLSKKTDGSGFSGATKAITFPKHYVEEVVGMGIACSGRFIMTCNDRTQLVLWDLKGQQLGNIDTYLMNTICARVSPCGRFFAASGFAPDVKIWEVVFSKSGEYQSTTRAFELRGHTSGVLDLNFSCDSARMATISKDGTWKVFDTKIEYQKGEDPHLLQTVPYTMAANSPGRIALSPDGQVVAVAAGTTLSLYSADTGSCDAVIKDVHTGNSNCINSDLEIANYNSLMNM
ncbi:hypothetical protein B566_EDAN008805 [Ephemera danica]|nr:hypothetical protein B566_EDAN008805 [Ephemera danica]